MTNQQKGKRLEEAVLRIERQVLGDAGLLETGGFRITQNYIVTVAGVRHEIDILVEFDLAPGYDGRYIFECKNWQHGVDKNEIIVFSEKIHALNAQHGFFVERSFTASAEAQADKDARVRLVRFRDLQPEVLGSVMPGDYFFEEVPGLTKARFRFFDKAGQEIKKPTDRRRVFAVDGELIELGKHFEPEVRKLVLDRIQEEAAKGFETGEEPAAGEYVLQAHALMVFPGAHFTVDADIVGFVEITVELTARVIAPIVDFGFELPGRGRHLTSEPFGNHGTRLSTVQRGDPTESS